MTLNKLKKEVEQFQKAHAEQINAMQRAQANAIKIEGILSYLSGKVKELEGKNGRENDRRDTE